MAGRDVGVGLEVKLHCVSWEDGPGCSKLVVCIKEAVADGCRHRFYAVYDRLMV